MLPSNGMAVQLEPHVIALGRGPSETRMEAQTDFGLFHEVDAAFKPFPGCLVDLLHVDFVAYIEVESCSVRTMCSK